ncbi:signal peptide containing protein [Cryptosporidium ryanae]|uniref:signal peptide containing protein n=1 Tax=Cryptosporidium ryanae TaxID=515981 RepID=UPI003519FB30|nr:signal peptide containing protein [Cryptosporidium ryanae]
MHYLNLTLLFALLYSVIYSNKETKITETIRTISFLRAVGGNKEFDDDSSSNGDNDTESLEKSVSSSAATNDDTNFDFETTSDDNSSSSGSTQSTIPSKRRGIFGRMFGFFTSKPHKSSSEPIISVTSNANSKENDSHENEGDRKNNNDSKNKNKGLLSSFKLGSKNKKQIDGGIGDDEVKSQDSLSSSDTESLKSYNEETNYGLSLNIQGDATQAQYDLKLMSMYLESQSRSSEMDIKKSEGIVKNNKSIYKTIKSKYSELYDGEICSDELIKEILLTTSQLFLSKSYCKIAKHKIDDEKGLCKKRCIITKRRACRLCKEIFLRKNKCQNLAKLVEKMLEKLLKILSECSIRYEMSRPSLIQRSFKDVIPFKCTEEDLKIIRGKLESKVLSIVLLILNSKNLTKLKMSCNMCKHPECLSCKDVSSCPRCSELKDIPSCSTCQVVQILIGETIIKKNKEMLDIKKTFRKIESCETYLASKKGYNVKIEKHSDSEISSHVSSRIKETMMLLSIDFGDTEAGESESYREAVRRKGLEMRTLSEEMKRAIIGGKDKLKTPKRDEPRKELPSTPLSEVYGKLKKGDQKKRHDEDYDPTDEEKAISVILFEEGICTTLMKRILEGQMKEVNEKIRQLSSSHLGCEHCLLDGCRKKRCSNVPNLSSLIKERNDISSKLTICNQMGYVSKQEVEKKIKDLVESGILDARSVESTLRATVIGTTYENENGEYETRF